MHTQPSNTGRPAIAFTHDTTTPQPSPAHPASATPKISQPNISQPNCDRWTELPVDVVMQVMYWSMLQSGSSTSATSFALTSTHFAQAGQSFRTGSWYQEAQTTLMHERTVEWVGNYLKGMGQNGGVLSPADVGELEAMLAQLDSAGEQGGDMLDIESRLKPAAGSDLLAGFRTFRGASLALLTGVGEQGGMRVVEIARALPTAVCLRVQFIARTFSQHAREDLVVNVIRQVAMTGRATAFELKWAMDLSNEPVQLGVVLDLACGPGRVSFLGFGSLQNPAVMLQALTDRCDRFRHLRLVMFNCSEPPEKPALEVLAAALAQRQSASLSRLTVVIGCDELRSASPQSTSMLPADERARFEAAGLYVEMLDNEPASHPSVQKVLRSIGKGAIDTWVVRPSGET